MEKDFYSKVEQFHNDCKIIDLRNEYEGYVGKTLWAIISDLSETELLEKYSDVIKVCTPFVHLSSYHIEIFKEFHRNEDKFKKRNSKNGHIFGMNDCEFEIHHIECATNNVEDSIILNFEIINLLVAIKKLRTIQRNRIIKYFFDEKTIRQIALEENVSPSTVGKSITSAIKNLKKIIIDGS